MYTTFPMSSLNYGDHHQQKVQKGKRNRKMNGKQHQFINFIQFSRRKVDMVWDERKEHSQISLSLSLYIYTYMSSI